MNTRVIKKAYVLIFLLSYIFYNTELLIPSMLQTVFTVMCLALFGIWVIASRKYKIKELLLYAMTLSIGLVSYAITGMSVFLLILLSVIMIDYDDLKIVTKTAFWLRLFSLLVLIVLTFLGGVNKNGVEVYKSGTYMTSYALGFNHPNQFGQAIGIFIMLYIMLYNKKNNYLSKIFALMLIVVGYVVCGSRTMLVCTLLFLLITTIMEKNKRRLFISNALSKRRWIIMALILFVGVVCPILMTKLSGNALLALYAVNGVIGSRFSFASAVINNYELTLFGNVFDFSYISHLYGAYAVDDSYINILYNFGIIAFVCFVTFSMSAVKNLIQRGYEEYAVLIIVLCLWGVLENILFVPAINISVLYMGVGMKIRNTLATENRR